MDKTTNAVRQMYEQYAYPSGNPTNRVGTDVELVLSYTKNKRVSQRPLQVLDAGCGRGMGIIGAATLQPDVHFHGIDLNRVALKEAGDSVKSRGLTNVTLQECNLMTLEGLEIPDGGFDMIYSSGVLHHLSDPETGLKKLHDVLAPHGVINLMVYASYGRRPLLDVASAVAMVFGEETPLPLRIPAARAVAAIAKNEVLSGTNFEKTCDVSDVELVDRLLNVNETSYDITTMWDLLDATGMRFIRWVEPGDWSIDRLLPEGELRQRVSALSRVDQFRFIELLFQRPGFEIILAKAENEPSIPPAAEELDACRFRLNPEVIIGTEVRHTPVGLRTETLTFKLRVRDSVPVPKGPFAVAIMYMKDSPGVFEGRDLLRQLNNSGVPDTDSRAVVLELLRQEIIYCI